MSNNLNITPEMVDALVNTAAQKTGLSEDKLSALAKSGKIQEMLKNLKPDQAAKLQKIISNKQLAEQLLSSPQARDLLSKLL